MPRAGCTGLLLGILAAPVSTGLGIAPALLHGGSRGGTELYEANVLCDANREWLRDTDHAVQCPDGNCNLTLLSGQVASAQRRSD